MSSEGNASWTANTIRTGSAARFVLGKKTSYFENGPFSNCHILQIGNLNHDPKYMRKWRLTKKVKLASSTALGGLNNTPRGNRKLK